MQFILCDSWYKGWFCSRKALLSGHRVEGMVRSIGIVRPLQKYEHLNDIVPALSHEFVENAVKALITRFMPLNPSDLETWMNDPEEWVNLEDQENDQWEYEIRV